MNYVLSDLTVGNRILTFGDRVERQERFPLNAVSFSSVEQREQA